MRGSKTVHEVPTYGRSQVMDTSGRNYSKCAEQEKVIRQITGFNIQHKKRGNALQTRSVLSLRNVRLPFECLHLQE